MCLRHFLWHALEFNKLVLVSCRHSQMVKSVWFPTDPECRCCHTNISLINLESRALISVWPFCSRWCCRPHHASNYASCVMWGPCLVNLLHICCAWNMSGCQLRGPDGQSVGQSLYSSLPLSPCNSPLLTLSSSFLGAHTWVVFSFFILLWHTRPILCITVSLLILSSPPSASKHQWTQIYQRRFIPDTI